ncbi:hypothetical protein B0H14DRAFT_3151072 [Mycena olivaceomarginata]|nr:hypothetical protein B0H14DRAFT_3151072 [Mycena olivaceomarginata]
MPIHLFPVCGSLATLAVQSKTRVLWVGTIDVRIYARRSFVPGILGDNSTGVSGFLRGGAAEIIVMGVRVASPRHYGLEELLEQLSPEPGVVPYSVQRSRQKFRGGTSQSGVVKKGR